LKSGSTFIDLGCGEGFFAIPAAKIVGDKGKVYALDVNEQAIGALQKKADEQGLTNLSTRVGAAEEVVFCESCADFVFFEEQRQLAFRWNLRHLFPLDGMTEVHVFIIRRDALLSSLKRLG
jgi:precorrin-6B methylase 2